MERSGSQKFLLVISIIDIVLGAFILLTGVLLVAGSGVASSDMAGVSQQLAGSGVTAEQAIGVGIFVGLMMIITSLVDIVLGILGVRAANDNRKIMPVWVLSLIGLIFGVIGLVVSIMQGNLDGSQIASYLASLCGTALMFWIANNIKKQAGL